MTIKILDDALISKIAAGEVIENPASVIKELVENSIDANSDNIQIELEKAGKTSIKIIDNGFGMSTEDAKIACIRHATSKISNLKDLFEINSMGFRGEALASISAVSKFTLITKQENDQTGYTLSYDHANLINEGAAPSNNGTTMIVEDIFSKIPARLKFLKSDSVELQNITKIITKLSLANPEISFSVKHNGKIIFKSNKSQLRNTIANILGSNIAKDMLEVDDDLVKGFTSRPNITRADKKGQHLFLNKRPIENKTISDAIYDAYHSLLFINRHPIIVLNLTLDPKEFDINVHPAKKEVRFEDEKQIYDLVYNALKKTFQENSLSAKLRVEEETQTSFNVESEHVELKEKLEEKRPTYIDNEDKFVPKFKERYTGFDQTELSVEDKKEEIVYGQEESNNEKKLTSSNIDTSILKVKENDSYSEEITLDGIHIIGQIHKTYIIAETKIGLAIYDQHACEERLNYEIFMTKSEKLDIQELLNPIKYDLSPEEEKIVVSKQEEIKKLGFDIDLFGEKTIVVRKIPLILGKIQGADLIKDLLFSFSVAKNKEFEEIRKSIAETMACRASIKAGDLLTHSQMKKLIYDYHNCNLPYCPHGRPAHIEISIPELEKLFKRLG